jgi:peptidoglycan/LPS O-acetylase OafA/YrhL
MQLKPTTNTPPKIFYSVQALRGIAALCVLLTHLAIRELQDWPKANFRLMFPAHFLGFGGVEIFFVLSGFIITVSTLSKFGKKEAIVDYALKRFYRIYPLYWLLSLLVIAAFVFRREHDWRSWMNALFLLPGFSSQLNPVSWSLVHEMAFYAVFGVLMLFSVRLLPIFLSVWAMLITFRSFYPDVIAPNWFYTPIVLNLYNFSFLFGVAIALMTKKKMFYYPKLCLFGGIAWLFLGVYLSSINLVPHLVFQPECLLFLELPAALITYGAIGIESQGRLNVPRWLIYAGDASFSIYLVHYMVIMALKPVYPMLANSSELVMVSWTLFVGATAIGCSLLCYKYVEHPLLKLCMDKMPKSRPTIPPVAPLAASLAVHENALVGTASAGFERRS